MSITAKGRNALPTLFQFRYAMFPEMARWALDFKAVPHVRQSVLPGPHAPKLMKLAGQTAMPVLRHDGRLVRNSDAVLDYIELQWPEPPLCPADSVQRQLAIEIRDRFRRTGPHFRRALFHALLTDNSYAADLFSQGYPDAERSRYRRFFAPVKLIFKAKMGITAKRSEKSIQVVKQELDWLAANVNEHGYLVGEQFSVADLVAAAVVSLTSLAEGTAAYAPAPQPSAVVAWVERWAGHPAVEWAEKMYRQHRPASAAVEDNAY